MYRPMDTEAKSLTAKYKHHISHNYINNDMRIENDALLKREFAELSAVPVSEFSKSVWNTLNNLINN